MTLSRSEEKLFVQKDAFAPVLLPICKALKVMGYETATIVTIMKSLESKDKLPEYFSIVNNRYLMRIDMPAYDLERAEFILGKLSEKKAVALTFWLEARGSEGKAKGQEL